jgi:glycosyltransferase involved in cell wall biosynthesis
VTADGLRGPAGVSVVTPTFRRPHEIAALLDNLAAQTELPAELIIVDGAPADETETERIVEGRQMNLPFECHYIRRGGGTAIQRNVGIEASTGEYIAFIDDDIRLEPGFFRTVVHTFAQDATGRVGGVAGYITNQYLDINTSPRWKWYRRLRLFTTYEPGRFDTRTGYPINRYLQPPHEGLREIDFCGSSCAVWRRDVFSDGLRFAEFFADYGMAEDAHFALRAGREWTLLECGRARCTHLASPGGRVNARRLAYKSAVNYRYLFMDILPARSWQQEARFWRVQAVDFCRLIASALVSGNSASWPPVLGKAQGIIAAARLSPRRVTSR